MNTTAELSLSESGVRRRVQGWVRWILDHTFNVRRHDGAKDKTVLAWRGAVTTALGAILYGVAYIIMHFVDNGGIREPSVSQQLMEIQSSLQSVSFRLAKVEAFIDGSRQRNRQTGDR